MTSTQVITRMKNGEKLVLPGGGYIKYDPRIGVFQAYYDGELSDISETYVWRLLKKFRVELMNPFDIEVSEDPEGLYSELHQPVRYKKKEKRARNNR